MTESKGFADCPKRGYLNDSTDATVPETDDLLVTIRPLEKRQCMKFTNHAPIPGIEVAQRAVCEERGKGEARRRCNGKGVWNTVGANQHSVMNFNALGHPLMVLSGFINVEYRDTVFCHDVEVSVLFIKCSYVMVHDGHFIFCYVVDQRHLIVI